MFGMVSFGLSLNLHPALFWLISGLLIAGLTGPLIVRLNHIVLVETISVKWDLFLQMTARDWFRVMWGVLSGWLVAGLSGSLIDGLSGGFIYTLLIWSSEGLMWGLTHSVKEGKAYPNQGIGMSLKNALIVSLITSLSFGLSCGLISGPRFGLTIGLLIGMPSAIVGGDSRDKTLLLTPDSLAERTYTPLNFIKFLDHCAKLIFLKKVGGGYIFIHRMLLEYFADLPPPSQKAEDGKTKSAQP